MVSDYVFLYSLKDQVYVWLIFESTSSTVRELLKEDDVSRRFWSDTLETVLLEIKVKKQ